MAETAVVVARKVDSKIFVLRGQRVILDTDLAELYGVQVRHLNQQAKRNAKRFPPAFRFQLSAREMAILKSQNVISSKGHGGARYRPYAFTEHGAIMAATVLSSERAIEMSVFVVLAFVRMRRAIVGNRHILTKLAELEHRLESHDADIQDLMNAIRELMTPEEPNRRRIGFETPEASGKALKGRAMQVRRNK
ncbi:MAG TPA: ORF6N domain-containing protein [Candidatus Acidoferrum sp.]|nr:ORF6N domain-containing protein [Candidatus Acidoferrum sp.]